MNKVLIMSRTSPTLLRRSFFSLKPPLPPPQTVHARRIVPYTAASLYELIADVASYPKILPYCQSTRVIAWSTPSSSSSRRWPTRATLTAGWGALEVTYTSRLYCAEALGIVEAVSGLEGRTSLTAEELADCGLVEQSGHEPVEEDGGVFRSLVTRWTIKPLEAAGTNKRDARENQREIAPRETARPQSEIDLRLHYQFANPMYAAISAAVVDQLAPRMVDAFVRAAGERLGRG